MSEGGTASAPGRGRSALGRSIALVRRHPLWTLAAVALFVRLLAILLTPDYIPQLDSADYQRHAFSIAAGNGYPESVLVEAGGPTAFRPPAYPYLLGGVFAITGDSLIAGRCFGAALGALTVLLVGLIGRRLLSEREALVAALIATVFPPLIVWQVVLLSEVLFLALTAAIVLSLLIARDSELPLRWAAAAGLLCGLATLTRSNGLLLIALGALGAWYLKPRLSVRSLAAPAVVIASAALVVLPWSARNATELESFVATSTQSGAGIAGTYNDSARMDPLYPGTWQPPSSLPEYAQLFSRSDLDESELDQELRAAGTSYAIEHPTYVVSASVRNGARLFGVIDVPNAFIVVTAGSEVGLIARLSGMGLALLAIAGAVILVRERRRIPIFVWALPALMVLSAIPISGDPRYRTPADLFLILFAAPAVVAIAGAARRRWGGLAASRAPSQRPPG